MFTVHAGVTPATAATVRAYLDGLGLDVFLDGDGWNSWGEAPGTDANDATTLHIQARVDDLGQAIDLAVNGYGMHREQAILVPSTGATEGELGPEYLGQDGNLIVVSEEADWAEQYFVITADGTAHLIHRTFAL